ncbi:MAG: HAMP domain-containing sensor histidine kinase [Bacillota bacterium]|nr:HAMP domain-containing sensor histidine kinase [Bacillota bacterium]
MLSLRSRLTLYYSSVLALILFLFGLGLYGGMERYLARQTDAILVEKAQEVVNSLRPRGPLRQWIVLPNVNVFSSPGLYLQVVDFQGLVLTKSQNLGFQYLPSDENILGLAAAGEPFFQTVNVEEEKLRMYNFPLSVQGQLVGLLQVGRSLQLENVILARLGQFLFFAGVLVLGLAAAGGSFLARLALAPVNHLTEVAAAISETRDFDRRVVYEGPADEIGELAATFNAMLDRVASIHRSLEEAYAAQRRFVADVSHELRTPLTTIRGNLELLQSLHDSATQEEREILADVVSEVERMVRLVQNLLTLARAEAGRYIEKTLVNLGEIVQEVARQAPLLGEANFKTEKLDLLQEATVLGNADYLKQLLLILLDNAFKYTPATGIVTLAGLRGEGWWGIQVKDTGPGIPAADLPHIFDRFYRAGGVRRSGAGLGLAIASWIAREHRGKVEVASEEGKGSAFTFWIPHPA